MCENTNINVNNCDNTCAGINVAPEITVEQAKDEYVSSLLGDIAKLQSDLDNEKLNCNRFQQLYCKSLATLIQVQDALKKNDINAITQIVVDAFTVLEEIEAKSIEESNIC